jgi:hypothetical protein
MSDYNYTYPMPYRFGVPDGEPDDYYDQKCPTRIKEFQGYVFVKYPYCAKKGSTWFRGTHKETGDVIEGRTRSWIERKILEKI